MKAAKLQEDKEGQKTFVVHFSFQIGLAKYVPQ